MKNSLLLIGVLTSLFAFSQKIRIADNKLVLNSPVVFKAGTADVLAESEDALKNVKLYLDEKAFITTLRVEGHVASDDAAQSQTLSEARAAAVVKWLIKAGVDCKRLLPVGFGNTKPVAESTPANYAANTRVVFAVAALSGRAIGGMAVDGGGKPISVACE